MRKIVVAFDHAGVDLRDTVIKSVKECGCDIIDVGTDSHSAVDFPDYAFAGSQKIIDKEAEKGIFVCGSGIGMCMAANKIQGIYAAVCHDYYSAHQAVEHDDINVLCLGSRVIGPEIAHDLITAFLSASFNHKPNQIRRVNKVHQIESGNFDLKNNCIRLYESGQSIWLDNLHRGMIKNGKLAKDIEHGLIRGVTSNPSIFRKAITNSRDYENSLIPMALANVDAEEIYFQLTVDDIRNTADLFRDLYIESQGNDGFVSLEVSPLFAHDAESTIKQAKQLWKSVNRPNLMIKVPVTKDSFSVITELTSAGINLNLTLIFSPNIYEKAALAYIDGLNQRIENGESIEKIRSVASIFVSRVDKKIDSLLSEKSVSMRSLQGKAAIRNAQKIYNLNLEIFNGEKFDVIKEHGGKAQRILWASTNSKNPLYKSTYYVDTLVGKNTVNTVEPETLDALLKSCNTKPVLPVQNNDIDIFFNSLDNAGINMDAVYEQLEEEGIAAFINDYEATLDSICTRCEIIRNNMQYLQNNIEKSLEMYAQDSLMRRIFSKDPTVWTFNTQSYPEIRSRLGWLDTYKNTEPSIPDYASLRNELKKEGISKILLIGTGGFSVTAEVTASVFENESDLSLEIIDSTDPIQINDIKKEHDPKTTLYIAASKSGNTIEVQALLKLFYKHTEEICGEDAGKHFIAITDPGSVLEKQSKELGFRKVYFSDASSGSRFSALTPYGIIPAVLAGLDHQKIGSKVYRMMQNCSPSLPIYRNEGAALGTFLGISSLEGKDKLTIITDPEFNSFGTWLEQLIAGSSGKEGKGIIPIVLEPSLENKPYSEDRIFVYINYNNSHSNEIEKIKGEGHPVFEIYLDDKYDLFAEFYRWEIATAVACAVLGVNAFDQPDEQESKNLASAKIARFHEDNCLDEILPNWSDENSEIWLSENSCDISGCADYNEIITRFISGAEAGKNYISINAYLPEKTEIYTWLQQLRSMILKCTNCATVLGFGPRFQHYTGQLQKGGTNEGYFIQIVTDYDEDLSIPNENISFKIMERAQSLADMESLTAKERHVIRIRFKHGLSIFKH